jgi:apolipoprotein D and lipocalin family protein
MSRSLSFALIVLLSALSCSSAVFADEDIDNIPVPAVDLARYSGTWHEVARLPMFFQRNCVGDVTAHYSLLPDGAIEVRNRCREEDGAFVESVGRATQVAGKPGALKVSFAPRWLSWVPGVRADYWIIDLDPDYQWAVVGGPGKKYLWILSRTPAVAPALRDRLVERAGQRGYPVEDLLLATPAP